MPRKGAVILKKINENGNRFASKLNMSVHLLDFIGCMFKGDIVVVVSWYEIRLSSNIFNVDSDSISSCFGLLCLPNPSHVYLLS